MEEKFALSVYDASAAAYRDVEMTKAEMQRYIKCAESMKELIEKSESGVN